MDPGRCLRLDLGLGVPVNLGLYHQQGLGEQVNLERCHRLDLEWCHRVDLGLRPLAGPSLRGHCGSNCASQQMRPERSTS